MNFSNIMNRTHAIGELSELKCHIDGLVDEIIEGRYDDDGDLCYMTGLSHLMEHLARAWHFSRLSNDRINGMSQEDFEKITNAIPKLNGDFSLVEPMDPVIGNKP